MSRAFAITAACERIRVDERRQGEIAFTISNASQSARKAQLIVTALPPASANWFQLHGTRERELKAGGTDQVAFQVAIPATVAPGRYQMRLDVMLENSAACEGQVVAVLVDGPARAQKGEFPLWILFVIAAVIAVGGAVAGLLAEIIAIVIAATAVAAIVFAVALVLLCKRNARSA
jgi:hypothetical protein